jgi:hypothetical protein
MGQGGEIMQGKALRVQILAKGTVFYAALHGYGLPLSVQVYHPIPMLKRDHLCGGVGDAIEGVARTEYLEPLARCDKFL